jgi:hypothetical protein
MMSINLEKRSLQWKRTNLTCSSDRVTTILAATGRGVDALDGWGSRSSDPAILCIFAPRIKIRKIMRLDRRIHHYIDCKAGKWRFGSTCYSRKAC